MTFIKTPVGLRQRFFFTLLVKFFLLVCLFGLSCRYSNDYEKLSAEVIEHYTKSPGDSLKLKAAQFLLENIQGLKTLDTTSVATNDVYFNAIDSVFRLRKRDISLSFGEQTKLIDSLNATLKISPKVPSFKYTTDDQVVTADFLIKNIDQSFHVWKNMPWAKHLSFEDFCEYILPYRCTSTYSFEARSYFLKRYENILKDSVNSENPFVVGTFLKNDINRWFSENFNVIQRYPYLIPMKFTSLMKGRLGDCIDANSFKTTALRSLGVPSVLIDIPRWGNHNGIHHDTKIVDPSHDTIKFRITNRNIRSETQHVLSATSYDDLEYDGVPSYAQLIYVRTVPKVYTHTVSKQKNSLPAINKASEAVPAYFNDPRLKDVTSKYVETANVTLKLASTQRRYVYLCVFDNQSWSPVAWAPVTKNIASFKTVGKNIVYLPQYYDEDGFEPAGPPFLLNDSGKKEEIIPKKVYEKVKLHAKFPCRTYVLKWMNNMKGGKFQAANREDLSDTTDIYEIKKMPYYQQKVLVPNDGKKYRYLIYQFANVPQINGFPNAYVSDIAFYGMDNKGKEVKLNGKTIGNPGDYPFTADLVNDGKRANLYKNRKNKGDVTYVGIDLGKNNQAKLTKIIYMPYGDDNSIVAEDLYELYYWDDEWKSIGKRKADEDNSVSFANVPKKALLLVKNLSGGIQERIFKYEKGRQIFW